MANAIIFGAGGQDAYYLSHLLNNHGFETYSISRSAPQYRGDVSRLSDVEMLIKKHTPDRIFHLAANSTTRHSALFENHETICTGTLNILESVFRYSPKTKVFITGSAVQFLNSGDPISESCPFFEGSAYAVARIQSVYAARYYRTLGVRAYVGYLFHHESPMRKGNHVSSTITSAVQRIFLGSHEMIKIGDLSVQKEFAFAGDIVEGILCLVDQETVFEATIGTGKAYSIEEWVKGCFDYIGKNWRDYVEIVSDFKPEYKRIVSDPRTINGLGWSPKVSFSELLAMMIDTE